MIEAEEEPETANKRTTLKLLALLVWGLVVVLVSFTVATIAMDGSLAAVLGRSETAQIETADPPSVETPAATATPQAEFTPTWAATPAGEQATTPEPTFQPTPPSPSAEPYYYVVQSGDIAGIVAEKFGVSMDALLYANNLSLDDWIHPGDQLQIPLCEGGYQVPEPNFQANLYNTLWGIAEMCQLNLDDLVKANRTVLDMANLDLLVPGVVLTIPQSEVAQGYSCDPLPPRSAVIEHTVANGERLLCLSRKFGVSIPTILQANLEVLTDGIQDGVTLLIAPADGVLYTVGNTDIEQDVALEEIADWYTVPITDVLDWHGALATVPFAAGQQLYIRNGDTFAGAFDALAIRGFAVAPPAPVAGTPAPGQPAEPQLPTNGDLPAWVSPSGPPPPGALKSMGAPWIGVRDYDTGYCPILLGSGLVRFAVLAYDQPHHPRGP